MAKSKEFISPILVGRLEEGRPSLRYQFFGLDVMLAAICALLLGIGAIVVYTSLYGSTAFESLWMRHLTALGIAGLVCLVMFFLPQSAVAEAGGLIYGFSILLLIMVLFFGKVIHGSKSWFSMGPFQFQPSEFAKFAVIIYMSSVTVRGREKDPLLSWGCRFRVIGLAALALVLVLSQHDVSGAISFCFIALTYAWLLEMFSGRFIGAMAVFGILSFLSLLCHITAGLNLKDSAALSAFLIRWGFGPGAAFAKGLLWAGAMLALSAALYRLLKGLFVLSPKTSWLWTLAIAAILIGSNGAGYLGWKALKGYQKNRLVSFVFPRADPLGSGYNVTQSKITVGSGGFIGRGILLGSQASLGFLPERHTDFAFAALGCGFGTFRLVVRRGGRQHCLRAGPFSGFRHRPALYFLRRIKAGDQWNGDRTAFGDFKGVLCVPIKKLKSFLKKRRPFPCGLLSMPAGKSVQRQRKPGKRPGASPWCALGHMKKPCRMIACSIFTAVWPPAVAYARKEFFYPARITWKNSLFSGKPENGFPLKARRLWSFLTILSFFRAPGPTAILAAPLRSPIPEVWDVWSPRGT
ncbi:MAG: FtsW/RodA/SpoVE family cell cycle protein [Elusimicrobia bacterium]|nr:FtsW/RodA/SpoVE family cell cycle protein [Elusimicrobiota bacterium]